MALRRKLRRARQEPGRATEYIQKALSESLLLIEQGRPHIAVVHLLSQITGVRLYGVWLDRIASSAGDGLVTRSIDGQEMILDLTQPKIHRQLYQFGIREKTLANRFDIELADVAAGVDRPTVLDIGGNIGFYALREATVLGESGTVHVFEPAPGNDELLRRNVTLNGYERQISVHQMAIGEETAETALSLSQASTSHRITTNDDANETISTPLIAIDDWLAEREIATERIVAVRMDIEGHELAALRGMRSLLEKHDDLVVFLEIHPKYLTDADHAVIVDQLAACGFEPILAISERVTSHPWPGSHSIDRLDDLRTIPRNYGLIGRIRSSDP